MDAQGSSSVVQEALSCLSRRLGDNPASVHLPSLSHPFVQKALTDHLLCAWSQAAHWGYRRGIRSPDFEGLAV